MCTPVVRGTAKALAPFAANCQRVCSLLWWRGWLCNGPTVKMEGWRGEEGQIARRWSRLLTWRGRSTWISVYMCVNEICRVFAALCLRICMRRDWRADWTRFLFSLQKLAFREFEHSPKQLSSEGGNASHQGPSSHPVDSIWSLDPFGENR